MISHDGLPDHPEDRRFYRLIEEQRPISHGWVRLYLACGHKPAYSSILPPTWQYAPCFACLTAWQIAAGKSERRKLKEWEDARKEFARGRQCVNT